jgi:hypothetical protein
MADNAPLRSNLQLAPFPHELQMLVDGLRFKPRYRVWLAYLDRGQGSEGLTLMVRSMEPDTYHPEETRGVLHYFPVPPAAYDYRSWRRWLLDRLLDIATHETCEFFVVDGERPYAPSHGPGNDPYLIREVGTVQDQRTNFRGELS